MFSDWTIGICALFVLSCVSVGVWYFRSRANTVADAYAAQPALIVMLWARLGPFGDGANSALAWQAAQYVMTSENPSIVILDGLIAHRELYDANPSEWREKQKNYAKLSLEQESENFETMLALAHAFVAVELAKLFVDTDEFQLDDIIGEDFEMRLKFKASGLWLIQDPSPEAKNLAVFLAQVFKRQEKDYPKNAEDFGRALAAFRVFAEEQPENEFSRKFVSLYDSFKALNVTARS